MPRNLRFWRNVTLIGFAHAAVITGFVHWGGKSKAAAPESVVWMSGGGAGDSAAVNTSPASRPIAPPIPDSVAEATTSSPETEPMLMAARSEIELPSATATPRSTSTPRATPRVKATPKPKPKPKPTATPKPKPSPAKLVLAKTRRPSERPAPRYEPTPEKPEAVKLAPPKETATTAAEPTIGATAGAPGGHAGAGGNASQFGWYGSMLHDRFYSEWAQPTNVASGAKNSVLVKIRIEKDGRVSGFNIVRPSGNEELDQSVAGVAGRVTQVEPLPDGLGNGDHYDVKISFELNAE